MGYVDSASGEFVWGEGEYIDDPAENCLSMAPEGEGYAYPFLGPLSSINFILWMGISRRILEF